MPKEFDALQALYKKQKTKLKPYTAKAADKHLKTLREALKAAWDVEDALREAIAKAKKGGIEGDKPADFEGASTYAVGFSAWTKACARHRNEVKAVEKFTKDALKLHTPMRRQIEAVAKEQRKAKPSPADKKKQEAELKDVTAAFEDLQAASDAFGSLKAHEVFYALRQKDTIEKIIKDVTKKEKGGGAPKMLEEGERRKSLKNAEKISKAIEGLCDEAKEKKDDPRKVAGAIKKAKTHLSKLEKLNDGYQDLKKKEADRIKNAKDKKFIEDAIKKIETAFGDASKAIEQAAKG